MLFIKDATTFEDDLANFVAGEPVDPEPQKDACCGGVIKK